MSPVRFESFFNFEAVRDVRPTHNIPPFQMGHYA